VSRDSTSNQQLITSNDAPIQPPVSEGPIIGPHVNLPADPQAQPTGFAGQIDVSPGNLPAGVNPSPNISTLAGSGDSGYADGHGASAKFISPYGVAVDLNGIVYVADSGNHRIRMISPSGIVTTLAGSSQGFLDGFGTAAQFSGPYGVAVDLNGTIYVADTFNNRIRMISSSGNVTTLAGSSEGSSDGVGTAAQFKRPSGVAVNSNGTIYVADFADYKIRKISSSGNVTTLAGSSEGSSDGVGTAAKFRVPFGVAVDSNGIVYVADSGNHRIRMISPSGNVTTLAGTLEGSSDGVGTAAQFNGPSGVAVDSNGIVYVADSGNHIIRMISPSGNVTTFAGSTQGSSDGVGTEAQFSGPYGVAVDSKGTIYVADTSNHKIRKIECSSCVPSHVTVTPSILSSFSVPFFTPTTDSTPDSTSVIQSSFDLSTPSMPPTSFTQPVSSTLPTSTPPPSSETFLNP
jgi:sugar lactone lactonase YvrE